MHDRLGGKRDAKGLKTKRFRTGEQKHTEENIEKDHPRAAEAGKGKEKGVAKGQAKIRNAPSALCKSNTRRKRKSLRRNPRSKLLSHKKRL